MGIARPRGVVALGVAAVLGPVLVCIALVPVRQHVENTNAALLLVLVVVAVAAFGDRRFGILAAVAAGVAFDFFLTAPYESLDIESGDDVVTGLLLLLVGVCVTEIAHRARQQHALAGQSAGYLAGLHDASETAAVGGLPPSELIDRVSVQLVKILGLRGCRFDYGTGLGYPRLGHDGRITVGGVAVDASTDPLPPDREVELLVQSGGSYRGRFLLSVPARWRPTLEQRTVAASFADQVGSALTEYSLRSHDA